MRTKRILLTLLVLAASIPASAGAGPSDEAEVARLERELHGAWNRGDARALAALYAEDGTRVGAFGDVARGRKEIEAAYARLLQGRMKGATADWQPTVRLLSEEVAVAQGPLVIQPPGGAPPVRGYAVDIWKKVGGRWQLVEGHPKLFPPPPAPPAK